MSEAYKGKRAFDLIIAAVAAVATSPISAVAAIAVLLEDGRPILFKQTRVGRHGEPFTIYKFRTMNSSAPNDIPSVQNTGVHITSIGHVLRRLSIDELPQLINVFAGDMSIVGPRPALPTQRDLRCARDNAGTAQLAPGLTGLAQVLSFDNMSAEQKVAFDAQYASTQSLWCDTKILARTVLYIFKPPPRY